MIIIDKHTFHMSHNQFDLDTALNGGYLYTHNARLSSVYANKRLTDKTIETINITNKKVIDVGCGDGVYSQKIFEICKPTKMVGIDVSREGISVANKKRTIKGKLTFFHKSIEELKRDLSGFDCAILRGVIHHLENPLKDLSIISGIADEIFIIEPNGYNMALKVIEKTSKYHRQHDEKSYSPKTLRKWVRQNGYMDIIHDDYVGLVPFFSPDIVARTCKLVEPFIESSPLLSRLMCGVYVLYAKKR